MKLWSTLCLFFALVGCASTSSQGEHVNFKVKVIDLDQTVLVDDNLEGVSTDELLTLLEAQYTVVYETSAFGHFIFSINQSSTAPQTYLAIYENGILSPVGIDDIQLDDGDVFEFKVESFA